MEQKGSIRASTRGVPITTPTTTTTRCWSRRPMSMSTLYRTAVGRTDVRKRCVLWRRRTDANADAREFLSFSCVTLCLEFRSERKCWENKWNFWKFYNLKFLKKVPFLYWFVWLCYKGLLEANYFAAIQEIGTVKVKVIIS